MPTQASIPGRERTLLQSFIINVFLFVGLTTLGIIPNYDWLVIMLSVKTFQSLIVIYRRGNFVSHHLGCIFIFRPLSYPFRNSKNRVITSGE